MANILDRNNFPEEITTFQRVYDLPASLVNSAKRLQQLKSQLTLNASEQEELNSLTLELSDFMITPETWNTFMEVIERMQIHYTSEVQGYLSRKQEIWNDRLNQFSLQGEHNPSQAYEFQNLVVRRDEFDLDADGSLYIALQQVPSGIQITDPLYWRRLSSRGMVGRTGLSIAFQGNWRPDRAYSLGDGVEYDTDFQTVLLYAKQDVPAGTHPSNSDFWTIWERQIISRERPTMAQVGTVWKEILD